MARLLVDEFVKQDYQCQLHGVRPDELDREDEPEVAWGADPFDIIASLEEEHGCPITRM